MIRRNRTDRREEKVPLPYGCDIKPHAAVRAWLEAAGITSGPIVRRIRRGDRICDTRLSDASVALVIKKWASMAGFAAADYAGHSLRAGFVTEAMEYGAGPDAIRTITRHRSLNSLKACN